MDVAKTVLAGHSSAVSPYATMASESATSLVGKCFRRARKVGTASGGEASVADLQRREVGFKSQPLTYEN